MSNRLTNRFGLSESEREELGKMLLEAMEEAREEYGKRALLLYRADMLFSRFSLMLLKDAMCLKNRSKEYLEIRKRVFEYAKSLRDIVECVKSYECDLDSIERELNEFEDLLDEMSKYLSQYLSHSCGNSKFCR